MHSQINPSFFFINEKYIRYLNDLATLLDVFGKKSSQVFDFYKNSSTMNA